MDTTDASQVLKDILKIGQNVNVESTGDNAGLSTSQANSGDEKRHQSDIPNTHEKSLGVDSFDSVHEQVSPRITLDPVHQLVLFTPDEQKGSVVIYGNEVHIATGEIETRRPTSTGSNRVRINPVVNFDWETKYYNGNLLSVSAKYMCYTLRGKTGFVLRILHRKNLLKALIKGFTGTIEDLAFAHCNSDMLACTDSAGDIFVWDIYEEDDKLCYKLKLQVKRTTTELTFLEGTRLTWCPHIEDSETEDEGEGGQILAVTVGNVAEVFDIAMIVEDCGNVVDIEDVKQGIVRIEDGHTKPITDISLAPDGSVLATASVDGVVKFWQLDFDSAEPARCLHEWQPHDGKAVSRLIFCDNLLVQDDKTPFWRFLITGANYNSELKIWCTVTWTCLQTIKFELPASSLSVSPPPPLKFKASLDLSAKYLVLSDVNRKVLYVFLLHEDLERGKAHVTSVANFQLTQPLLSFVITETKMFKASMRDSMDQDGGTEENVKSEDDQDNEEPEESREDEGKLLPTIKIKLHCINPKAMQELTVQYHPFASVRPESPSTIANLSMTSGETGVQDALSDVSGLDTSTSTDDLENGPDPSTTPKLIAPNAFTTSMAEPMQPPSEPATSSITSVTSLNTSSFGSESIQDILKNSDSTQVSEVSYQTCKEDTFQEGPSGRAPYVFPLISPSGLSLPESPDPAKVPFPAFENGGEGEAREPDIFATFTHSTPISRRSPGAERDDDTDKTPTGESSAIESGRDASSIEQLVDLQGKATDTAGLAGLLKGSSTDPNVRFEPKREAGGEGLRADIEVTRANLQENEPETAMYLNEKASQRNRTKPNLTVTPRKQINISPETVRKQMGADIEEVSSKLADVLALLQAQQSEMKQLRSELENQQQNQNQQILEILREEVAMLEGSISNKVTTALGEHGREQDLRFDSFAREKQAGEKQKQEKVASTVSAAVATKVEKTVKNEVRNAVGSGFQKLTTSLQDQMTTTMTQKLTATDAVLKESVEKMVKDKAIVDAIGNSVSNALQKRAQVILSEFTTTSMLPGFEKACQALFIQMNNAFQKGTQQYIRTFETYTESQRELQREQRDPVIQHLEALVQAFQVSSEKISTNMAGSLLEIMQTQLTSSMKSLQSALMAQLKDDLNRSLQETIHKEVQSAVENSMSEPVSHSAHQTEHRAQVQELINAGDFSGAFQQALTAADLELVVLVCQACNPVGLFSQNPCPLSQPILLSLIQQLSVDLTTDTDVKLKYLSEAIVALDTDDPITKKHVVSILEGLSLQIMSTMQMLNRSDPSSSLLRSLKILHMAAQSLTK